MKNLIRIIICFFLVCFSAVAAQSEPTKEEYSETKNNSTKQYNIVVARFQRAQYALTILSVFLDIFSPEKLVDIDRIPYLRISRLTAYGEAAFNILESSWSWFCSWLKIQVDNCDRRNLQRQRCQFLKHPDTVKECWENYEKLPSCFY